ncbi:MAG: hypothetical protein D6820_14075, partial [Lentisphaerae bacterium]
MKEHLRRELAPYLSCGLPVLFILLIILFLPVFGLYAYALSQAFTLEASQLLTLLKESLATFPITLFTCAGTVTGCLLMAIPTGWFLAQYHWPGKPILFMLLILSIALPPYILAIPWLNTIA